jgi:hypothetical protein
MKLNLGCGNKKKPGFLGVDAFPCEAAEILCDLRNICITHPPRAADEIMAA